MDTLKSGNGEETNLQPTSSPADVRNFNFVIADLALNERVMTIDDPKPIGAQVAAAAGFSANQKPVILQLLDSGATEELRFDEIINLRKAAHPTFLVALTDRLFRFELNGLVVSWPEATISGEVLRKLARKDETFEVVQELEDEPDRPIEDDDTVTLRGDGVERFATRPGEKLITVFYNHAPFQIAKGKYTTEQLQVTFSVPQGHILDLISTDGDFIELKPGETLKVKKGMKFISHAPTGQSS